MNTSINDYPRTRKAVYMHVYSIRLPLFMSCYSHQYFFFIIAFVSLFSFQILSLEYIFFLCCSSVATAGTHCLFAMSSITLKFHKAILLLLSISSIWVEITIPGSVNS